MITPITPTRKAEIHTTLAAVVGGLPTSSAAGLNEAVATLAAIVLELVDAVGPSPYSERVDELLKQKEALHGPFA